MWGYGLAEGEGGEGDAAGGGAESGAGLNRKLRLHLDQLFLLPTRGGPLAALQDGDIVVVDVESRELRTELADDEVAARLADWQPPPPRYTKGVFAKYAALVSSASEGAVTGPESL